MAEQRVGSCQMAKPIAATPVVKGEDARRVLSTMRPEHRLSPKERTTIDRALKAHHTSGEQTKRTK